MQQVGADDQAQYEHRGCHVEVVPVLDQYHNLRPTFQRRALKDGQVRRTKVVKVGHSEVLEALNAVSVLWNIFSQGELLHGSLSIWHEQIEQGTTSNIAGVETIAHFVVSLDHLPVAVNWSGRLSAPIMHDFLPECMSKESKDHDEVVVKNENVAELTERVEQSRHHQLHARYV